MVRKLHVILVFFAVLFIAAHALAQFDEDRPSKFGVRIISFLPRNGELRGLRSLWMGPGIDWNLRMDKEGRPTAYVTVANLRSGEGVRRASMSPITYTTIKRRAVSPTKTNYTGLGAGIYRVKLNVVRTPSVGWPTLVSGSAFIPEVHFLYGREFRNTYFADVQLNLLPKWKGDNWGGIFLSLGTRVSL